MYGHSDTFQYLRIFHNRDTQKLKYTQKEYKKREKDRTLYFVCMQYTPAFIV